MNPLEKSLRHLLERTVGSARDVAETAARAALEQLGVGEAAVFAHLSGDERELRRRLRVHGRQLGDVRDSGAETQGLERLTEEVAYEHWHRMLFARFLAENNLLMYPDPDGPVAVTLEECEDLAPDEGAANGWELASRYAARMLPQIFRTDSPVFQLVLPPEHQQTLERLVGNLAPEVFTAADSLGWVYQFWQAKRKEEVNSSEVKIGARELPAVTQLFTEPYMVSFLLDNSLGAWWAARRLTSGDFAEAATKGTNDTKEIERELRQKAAIPGVALEYLRFVQQEDGAWTPAAGTFNNWPESLAKLTTLDPCCGSGHFLVAAFLMLVPMRMEQEGLSARDAVDAVLRQNIHGLELDQRCVELAAFALALTAWRYPGEDGSAIGYRTLPEMELACSGLAISASKEHWLSVAVRAADLIAHEKQRDLFAGPNTESLWHTQLKAGMETLHDLFSEAPTLGSLIDPGTIEGDFYRADYEQTAAILQEALAQEQSDEQQEAAVVAHGLARAARLLAGKYHLVITNPPYLVRGKQSEALRVFCSNYYRSGSADIATVFLERFRHFLAPGGAHASVTPLNWVLIKSYRNLRKDLLGKSTIRHVSRVGSGATAKASWDVLRALAIVSNEASTPNDPVTGLEASSPDEQERADELRRAPVRRSTVGGINSVPDYRFALDFCSTGERLEGLADSFQGIATGDYPHFGRGFWEVRQLGNDWEFQQSTVKEIALYSGRKYIVFWQRGQGALSTSGKARIQGLAARGRKGIAVTQTRNLPATLFTGSLFDNNVAAVVAKQGVSLAVLWAFCSSAGFVREVRKLDEKLGVTNATLVKVPFDLAHWTKVAQEKYPNDLPEPYSDDPTQWIFHGHPCGSVVWGEETKWTAHGPLRTDAAVLQTAVARLLGYRWPAELDPEMELATEQREWVDRCEALLPFADEDGIVCLPPVRGESGAADRLLNLLVTAYGDAWSNDVLAQLLQSVDHAGKALDTWLRDKFFTQHCKLFQHRPFIWHVWDGLPDGFAALVNYHKLARKNLETLIYTYLGDWISRQKDDIGSGVDGAEERLAAAEQLKKRLELILAGESPHDIFVRWKPIEQQPIGWDPDLNDSVRLNIRPFLSAPDVKKKNAGVLRDKPNVHWKKDRGKDVPSAPWYDLGLQYDGNQGDRINDHHLTLAEKRAARQQPSVPDPAQGGG
jgi:hypothetical protein